MPRSNIAVDKQLAQRLAGAAEIKNKPIYALTNEIIKIGLDLIDEKVDVNELPYTVKIMKMMKDLDVVPVPGDLMELIIKMLYLNDRDQLMQIAFKEGEELGNYFSAFYFVSKPSLLSDGSHRVWDTILTYLLYKKP